MITLFITASFLSPAGTHIHEGHRRQATVESLPYYVFVSKAPHTPWPLEVWR